MEIKIQTEENRMKVTVSGEGGSFPLIKLLEAAAGLAVEAARKTEKETGKNKYAVLHDIFGMAVEALNKTERREQKDERECISKGGAADGERHEGI